MPRGSYPLISACGFSRSRTGTGHSVNGLKYATLFFNMSFLNLFCEGSCLYQACWHFSVSWFPPPSGPVPILCNLVGSSLPVFSIWLFLKETLYHFPHFFFIFKSVCPEAVTQLAKCLSGTHKSLWNSHAGTRLQIQHSARRGKRISYIVASRPAWAAQDPVSTPPPHTHTQIVFKLLSLSILVHHHCTS